MTSTSPAAATSARWCATRTRTGLEPGALLPLTALRPSRALACQLGGYGVLRGGSAFVEKQFDLSGAALPSYDFVTVNLRFVQIDSWDGEEARVYLDGQLAWSQVLSSGGADGTRVCGNGGAPQWTEQIVSVDAQLAAAARVHRSA
jgi:hypothetical protein